MFRKIIKGSLLLGGCVCGYMVWDISRLRRSSLHSWSSFLNQYVILKTMSVIGQRMNKKLERDTVRCTEAQEKTLLSLIRDSETTVYGKDHNFSEIRSREDFVRLHPLTYYDYYTDYVDRVANGERNIMTRDSPEMLGVTSGTSGKCKLMPTSSRLFLSFFLDGIAVLYHHMFQHFSSVGQLQKDMKFFYSPRWRTSAGGLLVGPNSSTPKSSKNILCMYSTPPEALDGILTEPEARYIHLLFGLSDHDLGMIEANFCSLVYTAFQDLRKQWPELVKDIENGKINPSLDIDQEVRLKLNSYLKPNPQRAHQLRAEFEKGFVGLVKRIWPHCGLVFCVTTGANEIYRSLLEAQELQGIPIYSPLYGATEGLIGLNIDPANPHPVYLLTPRTMFFEFIPMDQVDKPQPQTLFIDQVEQGEVYELVLTNLSGFYRYRFGDVIRVDSFINNCPQVEFLYRQGQLLNVRGEKTSEALFYTALMEASRQWPGLTVVDYCCAESVLRPDASDTTPYYMVFVEMEGEGNLSSSEMASKLESALCCQSYVYQSFRSKGSIASLRLYTLPSGTFQALKTFLMLTSETSANQFKVPRVMKRPEAVTFLLDKVKDEAL